jgi:hypothetical protein
MASYRLAALQWARFLKSRQIPTQQFKQEISLAFGADWEAIRKWQNSAERIFGASNVKSRLEDAADGYGLGFEFPDYHRNLHYYGSNYRRLAGLREIEFDSFSTALLGKENHYLFRKS